MKGCVSWSYAPYRPLLFDVGDIYICRVVPAAHEVTIEWLPVDTGTYTVCWRIEGQGEYSSVKTEKTACTITGLQTDKDYELYVQAGTLHSRVRLAHTGDTVGTVINYMHPRDAAYSFSGQFLCSPCLVRHPDGYLLASMDLFGHGAPQSLTLIFRSDDEGVSWHYVSELYPSFWGRMFIHRDTLYMLSCSTEYGDLLIGRSDDGGRTFGTPTVLFRGSCKTDVPGVHKNPQPVVEYAGRLWNTMEWGSWGIGTHAAMMLSAPADADLMDAGSWSFTPPVPYDPSWPGTAEGHSTGTLEGCPVVAPDGRLYNVMRYQMSGCKPGFGRALVYAVNAAHPDAPLCYDHAMEFPGNHAKFIIRRDGQTGYYYTLICRIRAEQYAGDRNLVSLMRSADMEHWQTVQDVIDYTDRDPRRYGFQYMDWIFSGEDILFVSRTADNGSATYHDSNYMTFHRIAGFRQL